MPNENFSPQEEFSSPKNPQTAVPDTSGKTLTDREIVQATENNTAKEEAQEPKVQQVQNPSQQTPPQKYQFGHDINGTTAATNHIKSEQNPEPQPEQKSTPQPFLDHDIKHVTAATNHIKQEQSTQNNSQQKEEIENSRRESDKQMLVGVNPKERAYVHKVLDNNQRRFANLDNATKEDNTQMFVRERHIDKAREEMEKDFVEREAKRPELTPKQKLAETERRFAQLTTLRRKNLLAEEEKTEYLNLLNERELLEEQIENGKVETEKSEGEEIQNNKVETEKSGVDEMEKRKKERDYKRIAFIAGVVAGGATGIIGGVPAIPTAGLAAGIIRLSTFATDKLSARNINHLQNELKNEADAQRKALLEEKLSKWNKVINITQHINKFLEGSAWGLAGSWAISKFLMGGKGIGEALASRRDVATSAANLNNPSDSGTQLEGGETPTPEPRTSGSIETPPKTSGSISMTTEPMTNIRDTLPFDEYPLLKDGLLSRGMDPSKVGGALSIPAEGATPGGWMARQREVVEMINSLRLKLNSKAAGFTIGEIVGNNIPVTAENVSRIFSQAATSLGN